MLGEKQLVFAGNIGNAQVLDVVVNAVNEIKDIEKTVDFDEMLDNVDMVLECASPDSVKYFAPKVLTKGLDMIIMSVGAFMDMNFYSEIEKIAKENNANIHLPSGAIVGLDGIKAVAKFGLKEVNLVTRKSPKSLGKKIDKEEILFEGKASEAVKEFPLNINVAATISMACQRDIDVKIIVDPNVDRNVHEITAKGDFGEFKTTTMNFPCAANPKTSMLAALSAIRLLKSFNETISVGM